MIDKYKNNNNINKYFTIWSIYLYLIYYYFINNGYIVNRYVTNFIFALISTICIYGSYIFYINSDKIVNRYEKTFSIYKNNKFFINLHLFINNYIIHIIPLYHALSNLNFYVKQSNNNNSIIKSILLLLVLISIYMYKFDIKEVYYNMSRESIIISSFLIWTISFIYIYNL